jgi:hypothetical protein
LLLYKNEKFWQVACAQLTVGRKYIFFSGLLIFDRRKLTLVALNFDPDSGRFGDGVWLFDADPNH